MPPRAGPQYKWRGKKLYSDAAWQFRKQETSYLLSKRLRHLIRLIALEDVLKERKMGGIPPKIMDSLRWLTQYRDAFARDNYRPSPGRTNYGVRHRRKKAKGTGNVTPGGTDNDVRPSGDGATAGGSHD